ncbi:protein-glutamate methylesterase/protein-glutamine glutaminase [Denitratisoma oestradiolicum]|uniref:Protein-glutamate methylesterase/protein-glutamine glutaminase n=1 Tax=Denitratisoma oestradiolicum TaxID=311182 RepID=A0A6S6Y284_9PROT|nr:chemotaxis response regulator protein-glutamate methylesterase [Denitratisoma oestradiolicum]TWO78883.1 chemotaxis response regulator protein-glutamate methylesterase [Denitratisoma oestradiolicum]CAB1369433.1 fused chemotaxis regulator; protein-glutamate methylesterase in two-component regulatory system with CheA [Denitratisoma oestradiolicum]
MSNKIKVLVVDDSAVVRQVAREMLGKDPSIEVIGVASDPIFALETMKKAWPDVIVLDIEMPRMDGITFLRKIMAEHPTPVVICSTLTEKGAQTTIEAMAAGAVTIITKPKMGLKQFLVDSTSDMVGAVKAAAQANMRRLASSSAANPSAPPPKLSADAILAARAASSTSMIQTTERVVAIGTSTGGTQALEAVLTKLPAVCPGIVIVQHMPEKFTGMFAQRLNGLCQIEVLEAKNGDRVMPGRALIAPGGRHMMLRRSGAQYQVEVADGPLVNRHKPSVDVLFRSMAQVAGKNALGIIMTGMGDDGARGLKEMHDAGAITVAEDESTCVVFGMPKEAIKLGAADKVLPLDRIPAEIIAYGG